MYLQAALKGLTLIVVLVSRLRKPRIQIKYIAFSHRISPFPVKYNVFFNRISPFQVKYTAFFQQDFALPDQARQVVFQKDRIFVGFKREYILINVSTGATTELFPTGRNQVCDVIVLVR